MSGSHLYVFTMISVSLLGATTLSITTLSIIVKPLSIMPKCSLSFMLNEVYAECQNDLFLLSVIIPNAVAPSVTVSQPTNMLLSSPTNIRLDLTRTLELIIPTRRGGRVKPFSNVDGSWKIQI